MKIRSIGHMACDGRVVAEDLVFDHVLAGFNAVEKCSDVLRCVVVAWRRGVGFRSRKGYRVFRVSHAPIFQIFLFGLGGPPVEGVALGCRAGVLWSYGESSAVMDHRGLLPVEDGHVARCVVLVTVHIDADAGIVVKGGQEIGKIASIFEMSQTAGRIGALRNRVGPGHALHS